MVMSDMTTEQENPSEFAAEKIAYFLQKFGAQDQFHLRFNKAYYGPYSGKVRYVLHYLNGSYIMGMEAMSNHPFDEITMTDDAAVIAKRYLSQDENLKYLEIVQKTMEFLRGYYSNYLLELLATTSYLMDSDPRMTDKIAEDEQVKIISKDLMQWSNRKDKLFNSDKAIRLALKHIKDADFVSNQRTATESGQQKHLLILDGNVGGCFMPVPYPIECNQKRGYSDKAGNYICVKGCAFNEAISILHRRTI